MSGFSKKSSQSYLKKNLIPSSTNKPFNGYYKYGSYQYRKNYKPFNDIIIGLFEFSYPGNFCSFKASIAFDALSGFV